MKGNEFKFADKYQCFLLDPNNYIYDKNSITKDPLNFGNIIKATEQATDKQPERIVAIHQLNEDDPNENANNTKIFLRELELYVNIKPYIGIPTFHGFYFAPDKSIKIQKLPNSHSQKFKQITLKFLILDLEQNLFTFHQK